MLPNLICIKEICIGYKKKNSAYFFKTSVLFLCLLLTTLSFSKSSIPLENKTDSLIAEGYNSLKIKDTLFALQLAEQALQLSNKANYQEGIQYSLLLLARISKTQNKFSQTLDYYFQVLTKATGKSQASLKSLVNYEIGSLYFDSELYDKSLVYYLQVDTSNFKPEETRIKLLKNIAYAFEKANNFKQSLEFNRKLLIYYGDDFHKKQRTAVLGQMAYLCKKMNSYKEAAGYELQNLQMWKEQKDSVGIAAALNNLGATYKYLGNNEASLKYFLESYELKKTVKDHVGLAVTCINISIIYQLLDDYDSSLKYLFKALEVQKRIGKERDIAHTCNLIAAIYFFKKNYLKAESYSLEAIKYGQISKASELLEVSYKLLSQIYKVQGNNEEALEYYQKFSDIKDSTALRQKIQQKELYMKYLEVENKEARIKDLMIEKELKILEYKKLQLEKEKKDSDWELLKREKDIQEITLRQEKLQRDKSINLLLLKEQRYRADASEQELELLKQQKLLQEKEEQRKIEALNDKAEINRLRIKQGEADLQVQKIWQIVIVAFFFITLAVIYLIFNRYKLNQRASQSILNSKNLEMEQKFLRAQMNPHFMFNALNSIQSFVTSNDTNSAERYLAKFSRLMRYILDNTSHSNITIEKEIKTLQLYFELEQLRFDSKFDFEMEVSEEIDPDLVLIPPMLTQPFVENAIIHGIMHKKDNGKISLKFYREGDSIICSIKDDGIGRDEALRIKKNSFNSHKSMGMQVTRDRLQLLNEIHGSNFSATILDLKDKNGGSLGTQVDLKILYREI